MELQTEEKINEAPKAKTKLVLLPIVILIVLNIIYFYIPLVPKTIPIMCGVPPCHGSEIYPITAHKYAKEYICNQKHLACNERILNGDLVKWEHTKLYIPANIIVFALLFPAFFLKRRFK